MIADLRAADGPTQLTCDLCVVGTGAAGLAIASEMLDASLNVVLVESGGLDFEAHTQSLYDVDTSGLPHPGSTQGRFRVCGGSTTKWGGQALPLMPSDFVRREWVAHSGWPISFEEVSRYYPRACRFLSVDERNFDTELFSYLGAQPPGFDVQRVWYHFSKWSPHPDLRKQYLGALQNSRNCTLLLHANVTNIVLEFDFGRVRQIEVQTLDGRKATISAKAFVLCVGGIESARLLLSSRRQRLNGIGNDFDLVGRFFQDHPSAIVGRLRPADPASAQRRFNVFHKRGLKYSVRCTATQEWQRKCGTLNISMGMTFERDDATLQNLKDIYGAVRTRQIGPDLAGKAWRTALHPSAALVPAYHFVVHGRSFSPGARMLIGFTSEQEPNPESRILLSERVDALGMPRANVRWMPTELTLHTIREFARMLSHEFRAAGIGEIELETWVVEESEPWKMHITDQFHHIGTARMSDSPRTGVVDRNCQVHGLTNFYVGGSAVFPTSGHSNPTLTIIALCMRMADRLKRVL